MNILRSSLAGLCTALYCFSSGNAAAQDAPLEAFLLKQCPTAPSPPKQVAFPAAAAMILEPVVSQLISSAFDAAGAYLTSATETKAARMSGAPTDAYFYQLTAQGELPLTMPKGGCVVLISRGEDKPIPPWFAVAKNAATSQLASYSAAPRFYFEAEIAPQQLDGVNQLDIKPRFLHVGEFLADGWSYRSTRKYAVALTFRDRISGVPFGSASFEFDNLRPSTLGRTKVINEEPKRIDDSIDPTLDGMSTVARVGFYPVAGKVTAAADAQKLITAPYHEAQKLLNDMPTAPERRLPEWELMDNTATVDAKKYQKALTKFCKSIKAVNEERAEDQALSDARCPASHLVRSNEVEEARKALQKRLDQDWAKNFASYHLGDKSCTQSGPKFTCKPPEPKAIAQGPYTIEAAVVETREANAFAKALASAFAANKEKYKKAVEDELLPSRRVAADQAADAARSEADVALKVAKLKVDEAEAKLAEAANQPRSAQVPLQVEVLKAKVAANAAARAAGVTQSPYEL